MKYILIGSLSAMALVVFVLASFPQPPRPYQLGDLFPPNIKRDLKLTGEQEKQLEELELEVRARLDRILTAEQKQILAAPRPPEPRPEPKPEPRERKGAKDDPDHGRPVEAVAKELGVTPEKFREAFKLVTPAPAGQEPTHEQRVRNRKVLSEALGVSPERLDEVMDKYRPGGKGTNGPRPK